MVKLDQGADSIVRRIYKAITTLKYLLGDTMLICDLKGYLMVKSFGHSYRGYRNATNYLDFGEPLRPLISYRYNVLTPENPLDYSGARYSVVVYWALSDEKS